jgi:hypothetical protein
MNSDGSATTVSNTGIGSWTGRTGPALELDYGGSICAKFERTVLILACKKSGSCLMNEFVDGVVRKIFRAGFHFVDWNISYRTSKERKPCSKQYNLKLPHVFHPLSFHRPLMFAHVPYRLLGNESFARACLSHLLPASRPDPLRRIVLVPPHIIVNRHSFHPVHFE